jgi:monothiol glutaredoxin
VVWCALVDSAPAAMPRTTLEEARLHPAIRATVANLDADIVHNVQAAASSNPVLVVGMAGNPHVRRARKLLKGAGIAHHYLEFGSYFGGWRRRTALKMWSGWPTFPMVFVKGTLIGGADQLDKMVSGGELKRMLSG